MSIEEIEAWEKAATARRQPREYRGPVEGELHEVCDLCGQSWPCDASILAAELKAAREKLEAVEELRHLIPHSVPNEPVYYPDLPECHPQCQRCKIDRILKGDK